MMALMSNQRWVVYYKDFMGSMNIVFVTAPSQHEARNLVLAMHDVRTVGQIVAFNKH